MTTQERLHIIDAVEQFAAQALQHSIANHDLERLCTSMVDIIRALLQGFVGPNHKAPLEIEQETIAFDEVFQDGFAPDKNTIIEFPSGKGVWYILRCKEHSLNFEGDPILRGAAHLSSNHHLLLDDPTMVVRYLGVRVTDCDELRAKKNNSFASKACVSGPRVAKSKSFSNQPALVKPRTRRQATNSIQKAVAGEVHLA
ncbi:hypothetical protein QQZ08_010868 [Neonectria magnoliae]|uniref:Uncharacterized protein n=1 Tax=Neonectria magnoliae TaxID=2732573 RepID=A0ABR1HEV2_9HYPO